MQDIGARYDEVPYLDQAYPQAHPAHLEAMALMYGLQPAPSSACRVLEVGCSSGSNLLAMAEVLPGSEFLGIDASGRAIEGGREVVEALGLSNVELRHQLLQDLDEGSFDYVVAHGVFSWVPRPVQDELFSLCERVLSPHGVAFISYNTLPGGYLRGAVRQVLLQHLRGVEAPQRRLEGARSFLELLAGSTAAQDTAWSSAIAEESARLRELPDAYLFHGYLAPDNHPVWFRDFAERAKDHGLQYLGPAVPSGSGLSALAPAERARLQAALPDRVEREHVLDTLQGRAFRESLLCRAGIELGEQPGWERLAGFLLSAEIVAEAESPDLSPEVLQAFSGQGQSRFRVRDPLVKAALWTLAETRGADRSFEDVWTGVRRRLAEVGLEAGADHRQVLGEHLLRWWRGDQVELGTSRRPIAEEVGRHPRVTRLVRYQAAKGSEQVTTLRHRNQEVSEVDRQILVLLDGTRDRQALVEELVEDAVRGRLVLKRHGRQLADRSEARGVLDGLVDHHLEGFLEAGLLLDRATPGSAR